MPIPKFENLFSFVLDHWQLCLFFLVLTAIIIVCERINKKKSPPQLSPSEAVMAVNHNDALFIDIRSIEQFQSGHILDSLRVDASDFDTTKLDKYKTKPIILVCTRGQQATALAAKLAKKGFEQPSVLAGGMTAWQTQNLPTIKGK